MCRQPRTGLPARSDDFVELAHQRVLGTKAGWAARRRYAAVLARGGRLAVVADMVADPAHASLVARRVGSGAGLDDTEFVHHAYRQVLGRDADPVGLGSVTAELAQGVGRADVVLGLARSDEYRRRAVALHFPLADLRAERPDRYGTSDGKTVFRVGGAEDFDWLESAILAGGYYDKPGVWSFAVDTDKRLMAEIVAGFSPRSVLELGCASGAVLQCLAAEGVDVAGVEISQAAIDAAHPAVRDRIHRVSATGFDLGTRYDVVFGLDIFEHLNPNRLDDCLKCVAAHLRPGGFVFANIPAFGPDAVFGQVFPLYLDEWQGDCQAGRNFSTLHTDEFGYPVNGHLVWAHTDWWVSRFESVGLRREPAIERAFHDRYDQYLQQFTPARRSFYVFSNDAAPEVGTRIAADIAASPSAVLAGPPP